MRKLLVLFVMVICGSLGSVGCDKDDESNTTIQTTTKESVTEKTTTDLSLEFDKVSVWIEEKEYYSEESALLDKLKGLCKETTVCGNDYKNNTEGGYSLKLYEGDNEVGTLLLGTENIFKIGDAYYIKNISSDEYEAIRKLIVELTQNVE